MTNARISLLEESLERLLPHADFVALMFYRNLFERAPHLRPLFPSDMQEQRAKLMNTLAHAVRSLRAPHLTLPQLRVLGYRHVRYGVKNEHYDLVGEALMKTLEQGFAHGFVGELERAWAEAYAILAGAMKEGARERVLRQAAD